MVTQGFNQGDKILELAIQHLRAQPIPEFPDPTVELPLDLAQRDPIELKSNAINRKHVAISRRRSLSLAAAAFAAIAGGFAFWPWETSSQKAFAQLQEAVRSLNSLVFELKSYSGDQVTGQFQITYAKSGDVRMDSGLAVHILNATSAEYTTVDDTKRTVTIQPVYNMAAIQEQIAGPIGALLNLKPLSSTTMRALTNDGKLAKEFKTVWDGSVATILVDDKTNLPIRIELDRGKSEGNKPIREIATNFKFNVRIEPSQFTLLPPKGYEVTRIEKRDANVSSDQLVLTAGAGLGPVRFGMSLQEVRNQLGNPDSFISIPDLVPELDEKGQLKIPMKFVQANPPKTFVGMHYPSLGLRIDVSPVEGVEWIRCYEKRWTWNRFAGMTSHGVKIGMTKQEVNAILEKVDSIRKDWNQGGDRWHLDGMDIVFEKDKCVEITLGRSNLVKK